MRTLPNYCWSFRDEAYRVWSDMSEAEGFDLPRNEETTTEELLLRLARKHKGRGLEIKAFTKTVESTNGADWAFWFTDGARNGIGARIQAKRLFAKEERYKSLYHQSDKQKEASKLSGALTPNQCETLLSHQDGLIPIYAFYNSDKLDLHSALSAHAHIDWSRWNRFPFHSPDWGIGAASPLAIKKANWGKDNRPGDFPMIPWHCLVCSCCWEGRPADSSLPSLVGYGLRQLYNYGSGGDGSSGDGGSELRDLGFSFEPTDNAPKWVGLLRDSDEAEAALNEIMDGLNLRGVAIIEETAADRDE